MPTQFFSVCDRVRRGHSAGCDGWVQEGFATLVASDDQCRLVQVPHVGVGVNDLATGGGNPVTEVRLNGADHDVRGKPLES